MPFVSFGIFKIKLFGSIGTCCDYLPVRLIHFPFARFFMRKKGEKAHKMYARKIGREKRTENIKLTRFHRIHTQSEIGKA